MEGVYGTFNSLNTLFPLIFIPFNFRTLKSSYTQIFVHPSSIRTHNFFSFFFLVRNMEFCMFQCRRYTPNNIQWKVAQKHECMSERNQVIISGFLFTYLLTYFFENRNQVLRKRFGRVMKKKSYPLIFVHPKKWTFEYPLIKVHPQTKISGIRKLVGLRYTCMYTLKLDIPRIYEERLFIK